MTKIVDAFGNLVKSIPSSSESKTGKTTDVKPTTTSSKSNELFIQTPIFILFAEILGYVSPFLSYAEDWCNPDKPLPKSYIKTFLEREARIIYDEMLNEYLEEEIHQLFCNFYPTGLDFIDEDLKEKRKKHGDDLPF